MYSGAKRVYYKWFIGVLLLGVFVVFGIISIPHAHATAGINQQLNFQGRLLNAQGATVPDGYYNMQFKIYQDGDGLTAGDATGSPSGALKWTENYLNNNGGGQGVKVINGYMSVNLGSITPFGASVDWNQDTLYLSVNIGNTNTTCTPFTSCVPDGEMVPMKRLSSTPYALNSGKLNGLTSANFVQLAQGVQTDASTNTSSVFINKTGTGNIMELQSGSVDSFMISNAGDLTFGVNANHTLSVATAGAGVAGKSLTIGAGAAGTGGAALAGGDLLLQGGAAGGTNSAGGNVAIDAGVKSGSGADGNINIGTSHASTIQIGGTALAGTQTVAIGNNGTGTTNVTVGAASGAAGGTTTVQSKGDMNVTSASGNVGVTATAGTMTISSSGNSTLSASAGTMGISSSGNSTVTSTAGSVGLSSKTNTTVTTNGAVRATFDTANALYLGLGATAGLNPFTISSSGGTAGVAGSQLTVQGGVGGSSSAGGQLTLQGGAGGSTSGAGGAVAIQGGNATAGVSNGGDVSLNSGNKFSTGTDGNINIGTSNLGTIQVGNTTIAGIQAINIGTNNTASSTTNVIIGAGTSATAGTTTVRSKGDLTVNSNAGNVGISATAGTMTISSSGNSSISASAGTMGVSGSGTTTVTSTGSTVGLVSNGNTTFTTNSAVRGTFDTSNNLYLGLGATAGLNPFTIASSGGTAGVAGSQLTVRGGVGGSSSAGGQLTLQGGAGGSTSGAGGAVAIQGGNATAGASNGGDLTLNAGTKFGGGTDGNISIGNLNTNTIQVGNTALSAGIQAINIGTNNTAGGTTNVIIGSGTLAAGTTTIQSRDALSVTSSNSNVSMTAPNGTMTISSSGNSSLSATAGTMGVSGSGATTVTSTGSTVGLVSNGNTTFTTNSVVRGAFDTSNNLVLGNGVSVGTPNAFTVVGSGNSTAGGNGATLTVQGGSGSTTGQGGTATLQGGTAGATGIGGTAAVKGANGGATSGAGGTATVTGGTGGPSSAGGATTISGGSGGTTAGVGGDLTLQGGAGTGASIGGTVYIQGGTSGSSTVGAINIGTVSASTIAMGNSATTSIGIGNNAVAAGTQTISIGSTNLAANIQTINVGYSNTAGGTTNVNIGSGTLAAGTTTIRSRDALSVSSSNGNVSMTAPAGTMTISSSGNSSLAATAGTMGVSGSGATTLASTGSTVGITSATNTTMTATAGTIALSSSGDTTATSTTGAIGLSSKTNTTVTTNGAVRATFDTANALYLGLGATAGLNPFTISSSGGTAGVAGSQLTVQSGAGGSNSAGGQLSLQGGAGGSTAGAGGAVAIQGGNATAGVSNGGDVSLNSGNKFSTGTDGNINIGTSNLGTVQMGNTTIAGIQGINIGTNGTVNSTTNVTIGAASTALAGTTTLRSKGDLTVNSNAGNVGISATAGTMTISSSGNSSLTSTAGTIGLSSSGNTTFTTNGVVRATLDTANSLYLGNGVTAGTPNNFTIQGTGSTTTAVAGGAITLQGGNATVGNANGGNITVTGGTGVGTGVRGLVVLSTPTFNTIINDANCSNASGNCTIATTSIDNYSAIVAKETGVGFTVAMPDPSYGQATAAGRVIYITAANASSDFTLSVNGGGVGNTIAMRQNTTATMIWNGADWTAAGASSSTTLQSAYDNTLQSAGGAELVVSHTSNTNGLTIRDSSTNPVNGTLLSVQNSTAAGLFSVNSNVTEYATDAGAEVAGGSSTTFPASTWAVNGASAVSRYVTAGNNIATGQGSVQVITTSAAQDGAKNTLTSALTANMSYNVSFTTRLLSGSFTDMNVYYSIDGTAASVACKTNQVAYTSVWTKVNCSFAAPASSITAGNAILIRQTASGTVRTFYVDNLSVTIAASQNYTTDGGVDNAGSFSTNWNAATAGGAGGTVAQDLTDGQAASSSAKITGNPATANSGIRNKLSINPLISTLYRVTVYAKATAAFSDFKVRYSATGVQTSGAANYVDCVDYNTQTISTSSWTLVTCYITTDATNPTTPYLYFVQTAASAHQFSVDTASMTLASASTPGVQVGSGVNGGPTTLFTVDRGASAPIAANNDALLGSMYYDTTLGKLQCYESDGWGACGSSPDNIVTISPEYTNAVLHGTGVGTMTSDFCSDLLNINDPTNGPAICGNNETYNFYKWTSPQASPQTYSIYVTYQLPGTFKAFNSGSTSLMGKTDSTNSTVQYSVYKNDGASLALCGSIVPVSTNVQAAWLTGYANGAADPSTCGFAANNSIVFKIDAIASNNANAYIGNLNFAFSNK